MLLLGPPASQAGQTRSHSLCNFVRVIEEVGIDGVDVLPRYRDLGEEDVVVELEVAVFVIEGDEPLVGKEDLPVYTSRNRVVADSRCRCAVKIIWRFARASRRWKIA